MKTINLERSPKSNQPKKVYAFPKKMSVRTEPRELSQQLQQTLTITPEMMAANQGMINPGAMVPAQTAAPVDAVATETQLHQANDFNTNNEHHPLERTVCINIRASLSDLCLRADTATWAPPSAEATKSIFQQASPVAPRTASSPHRRQESAGSARGGGGRQAAAAVSGAASAAHTINPTRHTRAAHCVRPFPLVDGVRSASSSTSAAPPRTRATSKASCCTR